MIWCRCGAHLVESSDDQTPDEVCCVCAGKVSRHRLRRDFAVGHRNANRAQRAPLPAARSQP